LSHEKKGARIAADSLPMKKEWLSLFKVSPPASQPVLIDPLLRYWIRKNILKIDEAKL